MKFIKKFTDLSKSDTQIAGGKGASLGEMTQAGMPVPPGFVVLASAFEKFLQEEQLSVDIEAILKDVNHEDTNSVDGTSVKIQAMILNVPIPKDIQKEIVSGFEKLGANYVAVRSSATVEDSSSASWAGELETYLNVTEKNLIEKVQKCWASLFTPRAIFYRFEKKLHKEKVSVAVVIQKMIQSEVSGITFTVHPVTQDKNQMVIEAGYGLGEAIVGGKITPDSYIINKSEIRNTKYETNSKSQILNSKHKPILEKYISEQKMMIVRGEKGTKEKNVPENLREKQKLPDDKILELAEICLKIEKHYNYPQDIEWAAEKNKLYITQSRPITTL